MKHRFDVDKTPLVVIWETTQASDPPGPAASSQRQHSDLAKGELTTEQAEKLIDDVGALQPPIFTFAGRDPLLRPDIYQLIEAAAYRTLHPVLVASATPRLTPEAILKMKKAGLSRLTLTLDGPTQEVHEELHGAWSFPRTLEAMFWANRCGLAMQVNTTVTRRNMDDLEDILHVISSFKPAMWNLVFMEPEQIGESQTSENRESQDYLSQDQISQDHLCQNHLDQHSHLLSPAECEQVFARIYRMSQEVPFKIKTTEAQHYRRYVMQQRARTRESMSAETCEGIPGVLPINEARGVAVISHDGEVYPGPFLRLSAGNVRDGSLAEIYQNSALFRQLRDTQNLEGKCGNCEWREICGGSRARVYAATGELFGADPCCIYQPMQVRPAKNTPREENVEP